MENEAYEKRRLKANAKLLDLLEDIDREEDDAGEKLAEVAQLYHELNADIKTCNEHEEKLQALEVEKERTQLGLLSERNKARLNFLGQIIVGVATAAAALAHLWMFSRSTRKEEDEAILTETDRNTVRNGLSWKL